MSEASPALMNAIRIAMSAHDGQIDKTGQPYILHPLRVMLMGKTEQERIVGVLHDVIEGCPDWPKERLSLHFSAEIMAALESVTKRDGESYEDFVLRAKANPIGREVKMNDLADNMDPGRLAKLPVEQRERLKAKYQKAMLALRDDL
jgi:(p)ppGpp synthase/HD superfamily hydrolase